MFDEWKSAGGIGAPSSNSHLFAGISKEVVSVLDACVVKYGVHIKSSRKYAVLRW